MAERRPYVFMCGTPKEHCSGTSTPANAQLKGAGGAVRTHSTPDEAFACHAKHLIAIGYTKVGSRDFSPPPTPCACRGKNADCVECYGTGMVKGPIRVLTKKSRFGAKLRNGKEGTRNMSNVKIRGGGRRGGNIASY